MALLMDPNRPALLQGAGSQMTASQIAEETAKERARIAALKAAQQSALTSPRPSPMAPAAGAARGLLGKFGGAALGPVGAMAQGVLAPGRLDPSELSPEQRAKLGQMPPEDAAAAQQYAQGVGQRAAAAGVATRDKHMPAVDSRIKPNVMQEPTGDASKVPGAEPASDPLGDLEPLRQQAKAGLDVAQARGELPVKEISEALVDKQIADSGEKVSGEERQKRISQERKLVSDLPNSEKTDYLSWAIVAAGLVAVALDKSGQAGDNFVAAFGAEMKRGHESKLEQQKLDARKAERAEDRDLVREGRDIDNQQLDKRFEQQSTIQKAQFKQQMLMLDQQQGLQREEMAMQRAYNNSMMGFKQKQLEAAQAKSTMGESPKLNLEQADAENITKGIADQLGVPFSDGVTSAVAAQMRAAARTDPNFDPARFVQVWVQANQAKLQQTDPFFGSPETQFAPLQQQ